MFLAVCSSTAQTPDSALQQRVDAIVENTLATTGIPSVSLAVIQNGKVMFLRAYGKARLEPPLAAAAGMVYSIGSISKQFTATAILLLAEDGKLSLDDPVSRFIPDLTLGNQVTIRQLLSHTSGYRDYWPQDYLPPFMLQPTTAGNILDLWARQPLDFDPGADWQYSNTNFVIAGLIVEKASGMPLMQYLGRRIFAPLDMKGVVDIDQNALPDNSPTGYLRYGLGPLHPAPKEGKGWLFAAAQLAMPVEDLAKWDIGLFDHRLLKDASYKVMETEVLLKNGLGTHYGLGMMVREEFGHRVLAHGGEVSGFTAQNIVFPDDRSAVIVLVNQDSSSVSSDIARNIASWLFEAGHQEQSEEEALSLLVQLQKGKLDRSRLTENCNRYFSDQAVKDFSSSLASLGLPKWLKQTSQSQRGGMTFHGFEADFGSKSVNIWERVMPDGKVEQFQISAK